MSKKYVIIDLGGFAHIVDLPPRRAIRRLANEMFGDNWVTYYEVYDPENPPIITGKYDGCED